MLAMQGEEGQQGDGNSLDAGHADVVDDDKEMLVPRTVQQL